MYSALSLVTTEPVWSPLTLSMCQREPRKVAYHCWWERGAWDLAPRVTDSADLLSAPYESQHNLRYEDWSPKFQSCHCITDWAWMNSALILVRIETIKVKIPNCFYFMVQKKITFVQYTGVQMKGYLCQRWPLEGFDLLASVYPPCG